MSCFASHGFAIGWVGMKAEDYGRVIPYVLKASQDSE